MGRIVREDVAHQRYLTVFDREVEFDIPDVPGESGEQLTPENERVDSDIPDV